MKYKILPSEIVQWDDNLDQFDKEKSDAKFQSAIGIVLCVIVDKRLPIIVEGSMTVLDRGNVIFKCRIDTKVVMTFEPDENPIKELVKMLDEVNAQENTIFKPAIENTRLHYLNLNKAEVRPETRFNKAYQLMEHARKFHLLNEPKAPN